MAQLRPPLAGRPPYATDDPDSIFENQPAQRRIRQQPPPDPNNRTSAYNVYDNYINDSNEELPEKNKHAALAAATRSPQRPQVSIPLAAPQPGYAAPVAALNLSKPSPVASPDSRQPPSMPQHGYGTPPPSYGAPPSPAVPSTPHPLQPPMTPIAPVFVRPAKSPALPENVKFAASQPIMRGSSEDGLLPKRGEKGDDFWRRFSMVVKEEQKSKYSQSNWLKKTQNGTSRLSRWVWIVGIILLLCIGGAIALGWYLSRGSPSHQQPEALGGSAEEGQTIVPSATAQAGLGGISHSSSPHVSPTNTVARRFALPDPVPTAASVPFGAVHMAHAHAKPFDHRLSRPVQRLGKRDGH